MGGVLDQWGYQWKAAVTLAEGQEFWTSPLRVWARKWMRLGLQSGCDVARSPQAGEVADVPEGRGPEGMVSVAVGCCVGLGEASPGRGTAVRESSLCLLDRRTEGKGGARKGLGLQSVTLEEVTSRTRKAGLLLEPASHMGPTLHWWPALHLQLRSPCPSPSRPASWPALPPPFSSLG